MEEKPSSSIKPYLDKLTLGVTRILETSPGVAEVTFVEKEPAERHTIISWEQKNSCVLPEDLKNFYLMTDGFQMTWSVKTDDTPMPLGSMVINSVSKLCRLGGSSMYTLPNAPTLADLEDDTDEEGNEDKPEKPHFDSRSLIFELDPCNGNGKVCLVYKHTKPVVSPDTEIWFLDRALYWHFLTKTFTAYYRLLITHLGLPQWQYAFTSYGVSPQAKRGHCMLHRRLSNQVTIWRLSSSHHAPHHSQADLHQLRNKSMAFLRLELNVNVPSPVALQSVGHTWE
ncbi:tubulin polyglutamylase complex subunit 2 isoform X2 [Apteryx rowi]|uniref:tubulin polyglutamylase complex subunit 2 isoform X2 n=1 Tax=Apteryx rowi TaxID=308060 RepID=UPI000E1D3912|nr:tubulin polyglutamylase complex subunit 2 isoform X2 [Apteryx rowi]XP_025942882.1 tubulin polyglutamylase complex subunit 2 isoform X2 [Apteryx rowi]